MNDFYKDLEVGKRGERIVAAALAARGHKITDLSDNLEARRKDIDMLLVNKQNQQTTLEIKNDIASEKTGNLFIETYNEYNRSHSYKGWFFYCEAAFICFLQETSRLAHIVSFDDLKADIEAHTYRVVNTSSTQGYLLPVSALAAIPSYICIAV